MKRKHIIRKGKKIATWLIPTLTHAAMSAYLFKQGYDKLFPPNIQYMYVDARPKSTRTGPNIEHYDPVKHWDYGPTYKLLTFK